MSLSNNVESIIRDIKTDITRRDIVKLVSSQFPEHSAGSIIGELSSRYVNFVTKKSPLTYNFRSHNFKTPVPVAAPNVPISEVSSYYEIPKHTRSLSDEARELLKSLDATLDPELSKIIRTQSFQELEELLDPEVPINIFISGESGIGKSTSVVMAAKRVKRPVVRINFSSETDFDDMICSIRLKDDSTIVELGPILVAMLTGSILLLDEVSFGNPKLLADLHPVLEGKGFTVKRLNRVVYPEPGFQVIATDNTKGRGENSDQYVGTNVLNKAFLERFAAFLEFGSPSKSELIKIINVSVRNVPEAIVKGCAEWHEKILDAQKGGVFVEHIGIRRLIDICKLAKIYKAVTVEDEQMGKALNTGCSIYADDMKIALTSLWDALFISKKPIVTTVIFDDPLAPL
jgi:hypothetical protein